MQQQNDQIHRQDLAAQKISVASNEAAVQADSLLARAQAEQSAQANLVDSPIDAQYSAALAVQIESKHDQAERIEDRLEELIERQSSRIQQARSQHPSFVALPGTRSKWQRQLEQQQATMQRLQGRLELVRDIKDGMGLHGPRIAELAALKLRHQEPGLADEWDGFQEELRRQLAVQRKNEQEQKQLLRPGYGSGMANTLTINTRQ